MNEKTIFIEKFENSNAQEVNRTMFHAYDKSKKDKRTLIDFDDVIWNNDVQPIAETMRSEGITEFTISVRQTNIIEVLAAFSKLGIVIQAITSLKDKYCYNGEKPAFLMKVI